MRITLFFLFGFLALRALAQDEVCPEQQQYTGLQDFITDKIIKEVPKGIRVLKDCDGAKFGGDSSLSQVIEGIVSEGQGCLRKLKRKQSTQLADELLVNVFADHDKRRPEGILQVSCKVPEKDKKFIYARGSDVNQEEYPRLLLNPGPLNDKNHKQVIFHELLHMTGIPGKPHVHNYSNHKAPDLAQACAVCCFRGETTVDPEVNKKLDLGLDSTDALVARSCQVCSGELPSLAAQQVEYARTELAQGNMTSYKLAAFELKKAVQGDPGNKEAWLLLGKALSLVKPRTLDRDAKILMAFQEAGSRDPAYLETLKRFRSSPDLLSMHRYARTDQTGLDKRVVEKIVDLEVDRARIRTVLQACGDFSVEGVCQERATKAFLKYKESLSALQKANKAAKFPSDQIYPTMMDGVREEYQRHVSLFRCMEKGGKSDECFNKSYSNPGKTSIEYQDWFGVP